MKQKTTNKKYIEEFEERFINKQGTENSWFWKTSGHHPFVIRDFFLKALSSQESQLKAQWRKEIKVMKKETKKEREEKLGHLLDELPISIISRY